MSISMRMALPERIYASLSRMGLIAPGEKPLGGQLTGGVSSDIWRVDLASGPVCVKSALPKLNVSAEWIVPVERNIYEVRWLKAAGRIVPEAVPRILAEDAEGRAFAMEYLDPLRYPVWKSLLAAGQVDPGFAAAVGQRLAAIHAATAGCDEIRREFESAEIFREIRLDPYLGAAARAHQDLSDALMALFQTTAEIRLVLVHGDVSPKNILCGPGGPVFLDAECACFGDPAFDLAFCLNHLLLKSLWVPDAAARLHKSFAALAGAYLEGASWEDRDCLEGRTARLLPGLMLARVDGKSPVEYLTEPAKTAVRRTARRLLESPARRLDELAAALREETADKYGH